MNSLLRAARLSGLLYLSVALATVVASRMLGADYWVWLTAYLGPPALAFFLAPKTRELATTYEHLWVRYALRAAATLVLAAVIAGVVFIACVNLHLAIGGQF